MRGSPAQRENAPSIHRHLKVAVNISRGPGGVVSLQKKRCFKRAGQCGLGGVTATASGPQASMHVAQLER